MWAAQAPIIIRESGNPTWFIVAIAIGSALIGALGGGIASAIVQRR